MKPPIKKKDYSPLWRVFNTPAIKWAFRKQNISIDLSDIKTNILETDIPSVVACQTFDLPEGTVYGIKAMLEQYQRLLDNPHNLDKIEAVALRAFDIHEGTFNNYPFPMQTLYIERAGAKSPITTSFQKVNDFAFAQLKKVLQISDKPFAKYRTRIIDTSLAVESFSSSVLKNRQIVRVTLQAEGKGSTWKPFIAYFVTWAPAFI